MTWHVHYTGTFTGSLKIYQVIAAIISIVLLTVVDYDLNSNYATMRPHALIMTMVCSSFFLSSLMTFMSIVMGCKDLPCSIFYRVHGALATVGFIVSRLTNISQKNYPGSAETGLFADALRVPNRVTFFADTAIAHEPTLDSPLGVERKSRRTSRLRVASASVL